MRYPLSGRTTVAVAAVAVASAVAPGCGGDDGDTSGSGAQPLPGAADFAEGTFDELPRVRGAEAVDDPTVEDDVVSQTYTVSTATPERVMRYYERELDQAGWHTLEAPGQIGAEGTYRGVWQRDDQQLVVSATRFSGYDDEPGGSRTTQYSLSLEPAERQVPQPDLSS